MPRRGRRYKLNMQAHRESEARRFVAKTNDIITFVLVHHVDEIHPRSTYRFEPDMSHQVFEDETIFGYRRPKINIYYLANSGYCYIDFYYDEKLAPDSPSTPDDVLELLRPWFPNNMITDITEFHYLLARENSNKTYGRLVDRFVNRNRVANLMKYKVTLCEGREPGFYDFHSRFQSLLIFFIDAANFIDVRDPHWIVFYLYEERSSRRRTTASYPIGFCTVYKFFAYPNGVRARISQFFILPPFQRMGLGYKLLRSINTYLPLVIPNLKDITVESPNRVFAQMRDNIDALRVRWLPEFNSENLRGGYQQYMYEAARNHFHMSKKQIRRIYEIVRYFLTEPDTEEYERMKNYIKKNRRRKYERKYRRVKHGDDLEQIVHYENILNTPIENCVPLEQEFQQFVQSIRYTLMYLEFH